MKRIIFTLIVLMILGSCSNVNYITVGSDQVKEESTVFVFENDTVRITYDFWGAFGSMKFEVYNKLNIPIFIDWKNSAYIKNGEINNYWDDVVNTKGNTSTSYYYGTGFTSINTIATRKDRVTAVPPKSKYKAFRYYLLSYKENVNKYESDSLTYNAQNSSLNFRNYLVVSTNEKFDGTPFYLDNSFYIKKNIRMKSAKAINSDSPNAFYVPLTAQNR